MNTTKSTSGRQNEPATIIFRRLSRICGSDGKASHERCGYCWRRLVDGATDVCYHQALCRRRRRRRSTADNLRRSRRSAVHRPRRLREQTDAYVVVGVRPVPSPRFASRSHRRRLLSRRRVHCAPVYCASQRE